MDGGTRTAAPYTTLRRPQLRTLSCETQSLRSDTVGGSSSSRRGTALSALRLQTVRPDQSGSEIGVEFHHHPRAAAVLPVVASSR